MSTETLATLLRIRRLNLGEAQRALAQAVAHRQRLQSTQEAEEANFAREAIAAQDLSKGDEAVDAFARWMPIGRRAVDLAAEEERTAAGEVERARVILRMARAACRSVEQIVERQAEEARQAADQAEQRAADGHVCHRPPLS